VTVLERSARLLERYLVQLEERVLNGDDAALPELRATAVALATMSTQLTPGSRGELLTTAEMAERLHLASKTLLKRVRKGEIRPALRRGKLIRWRGDEAASR
jgi:hypothetical protein